MVKGKRREFSGGKLPQDRIDLLEQFQTGVGSNDCPCGELVLKTSDGIAARKATLVFQRVTWTKMDSDWVIGLTPYGSEEEGSQRNNARLSKRCPDGFGPS